MFRFIFFIFLMGGVSSQDFSDKRIIFSADQVNSLSDLSIHGLQNNMVWWTPTINDISPIESLLHEFLKKHSLNFEEYKTQYIGYVLEEKKRVYFNSLCKSIPGWQSDLILIFDGGKCFFSGVYDIEKQKIDNIKFNGEG